MHVSLRGVGGRHDSTGIQRFLGDNHPPLTAMYLFTLGVGGWYGGFIFILNRHYPVSGEANESDTWVNLMSPHTLMGARISNRCFQCSHFDWFPGTKVLFCSILFLSPLLKAPLTESCLFCRGRKRVVLIELLCPQESGEPEMKESSSHTPEVSCWNLLTEESHFQLWVWFQNQLRVLRQQVYNFIGTTSHQ